MKRKLMLVEDEGVIALNEKLMLQKNGYAIVVCNSGEDAIEYIEENSDIDLILMDINLGSGLTGPQAARKILEIKNVPIVFLSSHTEKEIVDKVKNITNYGYVVKNSGEFVLIESIEMAFSLHKAHKEAQLNEGKYEQLFNDAPVGIFRTTSDGRVIRVNRKFADFVGYPSVEELNKIEDLPHRFYYDPDKRSEFISLLKEYGHIENFEFRAKTYDGDFKWVSINARIDERSDDYFIIDGYMFDIDKIKKSNDEVKIAEARFRNLFDEMHEGVAVYKPINDGEDFEFVDINEAAEKMSNIRKEEVVGKSVTEVFPYVMDKDFDLFSTFQEVNRDGETKYHPLTLYKDERVKQWVENTVYKLDNGEIVAVYDDTTEQRIAEENLKKSEENLKITLDSIGDAVISTDINKNIVDVNRVALDILGYSKEEVIGKDINDVFDIFKAHNGEKATNPVDEVLETGKIVLLENHTKLRAKDGTEYHIADSAAPIKRREDEIIGVVLVFRDVTSSYKEREELKQAVEDKKRLMEEITHRIKNNLALIRSLIELKARDSEEDFIDVLSQLDAIQIVHEKLQNVNGSSNINIRNYAQQLLEAIFENFSSREVEIVNEIVDVKLDSKITVSLGLILNELATNAIKHGFNNKEDAKFHVSLVENGEYILTVSNTGNSIPEEVDFDELKSLGLRIVESLIQQLRGELSVNHKDAIFTITFPK